MKKFQIVSMLNKTLHSTWMEHIEKWRKYFKFNHSFLDASNFPKLLGQKIQILFLDAKFCNDFKGEYYKVFKDQDKNFIFIFVKNKPEENDYKLYKKWGDNIVYLNLKRNSYWQTISILRRYWSTYAKPTTIIYKGIIADFIEKKVFLDGKNVTLTNKEFALLKFFLENKGKYHTKQKIFEKVWDINDNDITRVLDQILFKLKKKLGNKFFSVSRKKGVLFE